MKTNLLKSIFISLILVMGVSNVWAAGPSFSGGCVYFHNKGGWNDTYKYICISHDSWTEPRAVTVITNTQLWYNALPSSGWGDAKYMSAMGHSSSKSASNFKVSSCNHYTANVSLGDWGFNSGNAQMLTPASGNNNATLTLTYVGNSYTSMNKTITVKATVSTNDGATYSEATSPGTLSASSYAFTSYTSCKSAKTLSNGKITCGYTANTTLTAADATGYTFVGWYNSSGTQQTTKKTLSINPTADATYYAYYKANQYTITYKDQGDVAFTGSHENGYPTKHTYGIATTLKTASKTGYTFEGWYKEAACTNKVTSLGATAYTANITLYAKWTANQYTITYKDQGGSNFSGTHESGYPTTHTYGTATTLKTASKTGYTFEGWYKESACTNKVTSLGATAYTANITLYAKLTPKTYAITLNANGGASNGSATATYNSNSVTNATYPTRDHYECTGYYTATSGGTLVLNTDGTLAKNVSGYTDANGNWIKDDDATLHAQWTINQYTITYGVCAESRHGAIQLGDGTIVTESATSEPIDHGTPVRFTATPESNDYKIEGWYSDANCANKIQDAGTNSEYTFTLTDYTTVYVKFADATEVMSQVTVNATEGGTVNTIGTVPVGNKTPSTFTATPAPGYRFDEWTYTGGIRTSGSLTNSSIDITANGTGTLTAHFTRVHTVNFYATPAIAGSVAATVGGNTITSGDKLDTGRRITFTASVANTYNGQCTFVKWVDGAGTLLSTETTYEHNLTGDITVKGIFKITQYTLTFSASEGGHVSAKANNSAIASPANLDYNTSVTLTAEPDAGCAFVKWVDGADKQLSTDATYTITKLTANQTVKAVFAKGTTVYLKPVDWWKNDKARFAVYMWNNSENEWIEMEDLGCNGDIYTANIPSKYTSFMFVRLKPVTHAEYDTEHGGYNFANAWNQTEDLTVPTDNKNMYDMNAKTITYLYLKPHDNWTQNNARFAAYFFVNSSYKWVSMTHLKDGIYKCQIPTDKAYTTVIYGRMNPQGTNGWTQDTQIWNQTGNLTIQTNGTNCYTLTGGEWSNVTGEWSTIYDDSKWTTYSAPSYKIKINTPTNGTIAVTKADGSAVANNTSLALGTEIKIVFTPNSSYELINYFIEYATATDKADVYTVCGPTEITAEFELETPSRTVYLRPNDDWMKDNPVFAARVRKSSGGNDKWYVMHTTSEDYTGAYSCNIPNDYDQIIFVRLNPKGSDPANDGFNWTNAWNQTKELTIIDKDNDKTNDHKLRFAIGDKIVGGNDNDRYDGKWEENTPIWGLATNFNDWKAEKAVFKGYPGKLDVTPPFGTSHEFKLYNFFGTEASNNLWHGNSGTMKRANSGQWWTMEGTEGANCKMMLDVKGEYIYQMRFLTIGTDLKKQVSVTYPEANMYYVMYEETTSEGTKQRISYGIGITGEERLDTVSFFVDIAKSAKIYILDGNRQKVGDYYTIIGTGGENPGGAMAPKRRAATEEDPTLRVEQGCGIEESGVYNFVAQQDAAGNVSLLTIDKKLHWHAYTGAYYIRTDAANGGWGGYKQSGNKMTYTSYADKNHNFDHYYCKWITSSSPSYSNVKFCVANDYSHQLSDELDGDEIIEKTGVHTGCLPANANVRFGWDSKTNELSRAYISGSATAANRFLVLTGNDYLLDINGQTFNVTGLYKNEAIFGDQGNWVYQLDVQANTQTAIKLTAKFNDRVQTFFGDARAAADGEEVMAATTPEYHKVRMIYNFKTNHLLAAWLLDHPNQDINNGEVNANVLIIRENHGDANQLQFKQGLNQMAVNTAYATMTFTNTHVNDNSLSQWLRYEYWVSFPFDVKISDVFGFGEYGDQWIMQLYDGAERAEKGNWKDSPSFWKYITNRNYTLQAGVGYVLKLQASKMTGETAFQYSDKVSLYFPSTPNDAGNTIISATPDTQHEIDEHECTIERDDRYIYDSHWNLIGVPGYANIAEFNTDASLSPVEYKNGEVSFYYEYNAANNTYQATSATSDFKNMHSYMVQFAGTINWSTKEAVKPAELAARRNSDTEPEKRTLRLEIAQGEEVADHTFVQLQQEGATPEFDMNLDLTKIINSGANIYTLAGDARIQTAGNVLPMGECIVPVGVKIDAASEYTFRMPDGTEGMVVELIDYEANTKTNLLLSEYTTTLPKGTHESRFALSVKPDKVATSIENAGDEVIGDEVKKYIINGKLFLQKDGILYNAQGHIVR